MRWRGVFRWLFVLVAGLVIVGGAAAYWAWSQSEVFLRAVVTQKVAEAVPEWDVQLGRIWIDAEHQVRVTNVRIGRPDHPDSLLEIPEMVITLDRQAIAREQDFRVTAVRFENPLMKLRRDAVGHWNILDYFPLPKSKTAVPRIDIANGRLLVETAATPDSPSGKARIENLQVQLVPAAHRDFHVTGSGQLEDFGAVTATGRWNLDRKTWKFHGGGRNLRADDRLLAAIACLSPALGRKIASFNREAGPVRTAAAEEGQVTTVTTWNRANAKQHPLQIGLAALANLQFQISSAEDEQSPPDWHVKTELISGELQNRVFPDPLFNLQGTIEATADRLEVRNLSAVSGTSRLAVSGLLARSNEGIAKHFQIEAEHLEFGPPLRAYLATLPLPDSITEIYDQLQPAGAVNLIAEVRDVPGQAPLYLLKELKALEASVTPVQFPYTFTGITGTLRQTGDVMQVAMNGWAGRQPVALSGTINNPGPTARVLLDVQGDSLPIDQDALNALATEKLNDVADAIGALRLVGTCDVRAQLSRAPVDGAQIDVALNILLRNARIEYENFPYPLEQVTGRVTFDPRIADVWHFEEFTGRHSGGTVTAFATFDRRKPPGYFDLHLNVQDAPIDRIRDASVEAGPEFDGLWREVTANGLVSFQDARLQWIVGGPMQLSLPSIRLQQAQVKLRSFPYTWNNVTAELSYQPQQQRVTVHSMTGSREQVALTIPGSQRSGMLEGGAAFFELEPEPGIAWRAHADSVDVRNLEAKEDLHRALPAGLQQTLATIRPQRPFHANFGLDLKSSHAGVTTASWGGDFIFPDNDLFLGVQLTNVSGRVSIPKLDYDETARMSTPGSIRFNTMTAFGTRFANVRGPFLVNDRQIMVGSYEMTRQVGRNDAPPQANDHERVLADIYGGVVGLDAVARLDWEQPERTGYAVRVTLSGAELRQWANANGFQSANLSGRMKGNLRLVGRGSSLRNLHGENGYLQISDARIYELPVMARVLQALNSWPPDDTAFRYAFLGFDVHDGRFDFNEIRLEGDTISFAGAGTVEFAGENAGALNLELNSRMPRGGIPVFNVVTDDWVGVKVLGSVNHPVATITTTPFGGFLRALERGTRPFTPPITNGWPLAPTARQNPSR